ncbi:16S rRNA (guanine(966)-N(2))-methyltransferase RsmD [bacterium]|nr:16S rRNA (guanine(966)-N(2))-methyltransferase RsmD [bacterium]
MRIISGKFKGFRFPEKNLPHVRPTTDRAKEALFNMLHLQYDFDQLKVLDLYSGTGNMAFEFISRGTEDITMVEMNRKSLMYIKSISSALKVEPRVVQEKCLSFLNRTNQKYSLIFADPPYASREYIHLLELIEQRELLMQDGILIMEHDINLSFSPFTPDEQRKYGQSMFSFFTFD